MNSKEIFLFILGVFIFLFGLVMLTGAVLIIFENRPGDSVYGNAAGAFFMGVLPMTVGFLICKKMFSSNTERENNLIEQKILRLAKEGNGKITAAEAAMNSDFSLDQAKKILDQYVKKGYCDIGVTQKGGIIYIFPNIISDEDKKDIEEF